VERVGCLVVIGGDGGGMSTREEQEKLKMANMLSKQTASAHNKLTRMPWSVNNKICASKKSKP